jgi:uncharacterized Zn finger protein
MTVFKRSSIYLTCLFCGHKDFDIIRHTSTKSKLLRCKRCGFMVKDSGYLDQMPKGASVPTDGSSLYAVRKEGCTERGS